MTVLADLDAATAAHLDRYTDEWRATLEDPVTLRRFVSLVNVPDEVDGDLAYVSERGQPRPAAAPSATAPIAAADPS